MKVQLHSLFPIHSIGFYFRYNLLDAEKIMRKRKKKFESRKFHYLRSGGNRKFSLYLKIIGFFRLVHLNFGFLAAKGMK